MYDRAVGMRPLLGLAVLAGALLAGPALAPERLMELMSLDKKAAQGRTRFVVLEAIGRARLAADLDDAQVRRAVVAAAR